MTKLQRSVERPRRRVALRWVVGVASAVVIATKLIMVPWLKDRWGISRAEIARRFVTEYGEAIPRWEAEHPGRACPSSVRELTKYTRFGDVRDPYGEGLQLACTTRGFAVYSFGEDGRFGTADDLWGTR